MRVAYLVVLITGLVACHANQADIPLPEPTITTPLPPLRRVSKEAQRPTPAPAPKPGTAPSTPEAIQQLDETLHKLRDRVSQ